MLRYCPSSFNFTFHTSLGVTGVSSVFKSCGKGAVRVFNTIILIIIIIPNSHKVSYMIRGMDQD